MGEGTGNGEGFYIIHAKLGLIHVIRSGLKAGEALSFCSLTAGIAIAAE